MPRFNFSALVSLTLLFLAAPAIAGTVAIVQPDSPTAEATETVSRLHGELISVGLEVRIVASPANRSREQTDSRLWVEKIAADGGLDAVIDVGGSSPTWVDVWVIEKSPKRVELWRVAGEPNAVNASERLAIRAIEVLRSSFLESDMSAKERPPEPTAITTESRPRRQSEVHHETMHSDRMGIGLGGSVLTSPGGLSPALLPVVHFDAIANRGLGVHAELAGLGTRPTASNAMGHARVAQEYASLGGSYGFLPTRGLSPFVVLSAGALHTGVRGTADAPLQAHTKDQWSFLLDASAGARLRLANHYYLRLSGHVQLAEPYVVIHVVNTTIASSGRPSLALTLTVEAWL